MKWRLLTNEVARAAWIWGGRRVAFVEVTCSCEYIGIFRTGRKVFEGRCGGCGCLFSLDRAGSVSPLLP